LHIPLPPPSAISTLSLHDALPICPRLHEDMIKIKDLSARARQIAVTNIGRDEPTLVLTNDLTTPAKDLFARYAERMMVENELDRSEEHTSELQSRENLVCRLLLEK